MSLLQALKVKIGPNSRPGKHVMCCKCGVLEVELLDWLAVRPRPQQEDRCTAQASTGAHMFAHRHCWKKHYPGQEPQGCPSMCLYTGDTLQDLW